GLGATLVAAFPAAAAPAPAPAPATPAFAVRLGGVAALGLAGFDLLGLLAGVRLLGLLFVDGHGVDADGGGRGPNRLGPGHRLHAVDHEHGRAGEMLVR